MESYFYHVPGLKVVRPSTPMDAKGLLKSAIRDDNPVIFIESETLYNVKGEVPEDPDFMIPLGKAIVRREGTDVTVIAYMGMMYRAHGGGRGARQGRASRSRSSIRARCARWTRRRSSAPCGRPTARSSSRRARASRAWARRSPAFITEQAFDDLDAPVERVTGANAPMPYARNLEKLKTPTKERIIDAVRRVCYANGS